MGENRHVWRHEIMLLCLHSQTSAHVPISCKMKAHSCLPMIVAGFQCLPAFQTKPITKTLCLRLKISYFLFKYCICFPQLTFSISFWKKMGFFFPLAFCSTRAEEFILFQYHFMLNFQLKSWKYLFYYIGLIWCFAP